VLKPTGGDRDSSSVPLQPSLGARTSTTWHWESLLMRSPIAPSHRRIGTTNKANADQDMQLEAMRAQNSMALERQKAVHAAQLEMMKEQAKQL
jgi:hypothetical protein